MNTARYLPRPMYISKHGFYTLIALYMLVLGVSPTLAAIAVGFKNPGIVVISHLLIVAGLSFILGLKNTKAALLVLMLLLLWQPVLSMPFAKIVGSTGIKMFVATKDIYVGVLLPTLFLRNGKKVKWTIVDWGATLFLLVYFTFAVISPASLLGIAISFRQGFAIVAFYLVGRLSLLDSVGVQWFLITVVAVAIGAASFGYVERFFFNEYTWTKIGPVEYLEAKKGVENTSTRYQIEGKMPFNWYTSINGNLYRRMVAGIGDPTSLSRFLSLPVLTLIFIPNLFRKFSFRVFLLLLLSGALVLTFGRGGILIVVGGVAIWAVVRRPILSFLIMPAIALIFFIVPLFDLQSGSAPRHIRKALGGVQELLNSPIGSGLGTAGGLAVYYSEQAQADRDTSESYLAALAFQLGIPGVVSYTFFMIAMAYRLFGVYVKTKRRDKLVSRMALLGTSIVMGIFLTSLLSNSAVSPISAGLSLSYCGATIGVYNIQKKCDKLITEQRSVIN